MAIFDRIKKLFPQHLSYTPLEDLTTEILVDILDCDNALLTSFTNEVLGISGKNFKIYSQVYYYLEDDRSCFIDAVISNRESICFIENKIESVEGYEQLYRYAKVLNRFCGNFKTHLRYITKYDEEKENSFGHNFGQLKWKNVADFLTKYSNNPKIFDFLLFLRNNGMNTNFTIDAKSIFLMEETQNLFYKIDSHLNQIKVDAEKLLKVGFSRPDLGLQIIRKNRFIFWKSPIIGAVANRSDLSAGFYFGEQPSVNVSLWVSTNNEQYELFVKEVKGNITTPQGEDGLVTFSKPLVEFIHEAYNDRLIQAWYIEKFKIIKEFIDRTPNLNWNLK